VNNKVKEIVVLSIFCALIVLCGLIPQIGYITFIPGFPAVTILHLIVLTGIMSLPSFLDSKDKKHDIRLLFYPLVIGFVFGLTSLIVSFIYGVTPFDIAFRNPLISILPRMLFGFVAGLLIGAFRKLNNIVKEKRVLSFLLVAVFLNILLLGAAYAITNANFVDRFAEVFPKAILIVESIWILLCVGYYFLIRKIETKYSYIPVSILLSTLLHTILVLGLFSLFGKEIYLEYFGDYSFKIVFGFIMGTLFANGVIEALVAVIIGTPISIAVNKYLFKEEQVEESKITEEEK